MKEGAKQGLRYRVGEYTSDIIKGIVTSAILGALPWLWSRITTLKWPDMPLNQRPWFVASLIYVLTIVALPLTLWIWRVHLLSYLRKIYYFQRQRFVVNLLLSLLVPIPFAVSVAILVAPREVRDAAAEILFPEASAFGPVFIRTFATNGKTEYQFVPETPISGPHGYARITLATYDDTVKQNAGWVLYFIRGADLSDQSQLRFFIRGEAGGGKDWHKTKGRPRD